jgi:hypothetical protein
VPKRIDSIVITSRSLVFREVSGRRPRFPGEK